MKISTLAFIALALSAAPALAVSTSQINSQLVQAGYSNVQIEQHGQTYKVTARKGSEVRELVYDVQTGRILSDRIDSNGDGQMDRVVNHSNGNDDGNSSGRNGGDDNDGDNDSGRGNDNDNDNDRGNDNDNGGDRDHDNGGESDNDD